MKTNNLLSQRDNSYTGQTDKLSDTSMDNCGKCIPLKSLRFESIIDSIKSILDGKHNQYRSDPINVLSTDDLLCQIKIKAVRAQLAIRPEKMEDELLDIIVYSMLTLKKVYADNPELERKKYDRKY